VHHARRKKGGERIGESPNDESTNTPEKKQVNSDEFNHFCEKCKINQQLLTLFA
jgi:hypothetical protein